MISIPGYDVTEKRYEGMNSIVYRGQRKSDTKPIIIKLLNKTYPTPIELARFKHEYRITGSLNSEGVIRVHGLEKSGNSLVMVLEDFGGESLDRIIARGPLTLTDFLPLGIRLADFLGQIHQLNIIYRDNEVHDGHPLMMTIDEVHKCETTSNKLLLRLFLDPLNLPTVNRIIADTLHCETERSRPLYARTQLEKADIFRMRLIQYTILGKLERAIQQAKSGLSLVGTKMPAKATKLSVLKK